jgi:toxin ParE1/3/4
MNLKPVFRKEARLEYTAAVLWYERQRRGLGAQFEARVEEALTLACRSPHQFSALIGDVRRVKVRRFPFTIFFRVRDEKLRVLAVFHARRNPRKWRERA